MAFVHVTREKHTRGVLICEDVAFLTSVHLYPNETFKMKCTNTYFAEVHALPKQKQIISS